MTTIQHTTTIPADQYGRISGKTLADLFSKVANVMSGDAEAVAFATHVTHDHRTLQQTMFAMMMMTVVAMAENADEGCFDERNEQSSKLAQKIRDLLVAEDVLIRNGIVRLSFI